MSKEKDRQDEPGSRAFTHAGGIVYRLANGKPEFFVVTAKSNPFHWIFPRGHIEKGEQPAETAEREVREETGLIARIVGEAGSFQYANGGKFLNIMFFLMERTGGNEGDSTEGRLWRWCSLEDALALLSFPEYRVCLRNAFHKLQTMP
jgi:8-oxo-dGTP pyrophosphatase MutT (NUDIX family)